MHAILNFKEFYMKIVPWIIIVFMIYLIYYFISRSEKRLNKIEENLSELKKATEANRLLIEEAKLDSEDDEKEQE